MEDTDKQELNLSFLQHEDVEKFFADLNIMLLSGKHVDQADYAVFTLIEKYEPAWEYFYKLLYKLQLIADNFDGNRYYYLDFFDSGKGKFSDNSRNKELTPLQTVIGLMLVDLYYQKYFDERKLVSWSELKVILMEGEQQQAYRRILFNVSRDTVDEKEWGTAESKFKSAISSFEKLGWVTRHSNQHEELLFEIRPAIHRLGKLYAKELEDFDNFSLQYKPEN